MPIKEFRVPGDPPKKQGRIVDVVRGLGKIARLNMNAVNVMPYSANVEIQTKAQQYKAFVAYMKRYPDYYPKVTRDKLEPREDYMFSRPDAAKMQYDAPNPLREEQRNAADLIYDRIKD